MRVIILGGDGFCGWPTSLHLSRRGYDVLIVDDGSRRRIDKELGVGSLTPIAPLQVRLHAWNALTGLHIDHQSITIGDEYQQLLEAIVAFEPNAIVHLAEQKSAPYSMRSAAHKHATVASNVVGTQDVCAAIVESGAQIHLVHLGTMGVYGYESDGTEIPEGYDDRSSNSSENLQRKTLYPSDPGSIYHLTKAQDQLTFQFYSKNDGLAITDLHQGIVWGTQTPETELDERLINRLDYDGDFGTVLNRFVMQAAIGHPLIVHGSGGQRRAFINILDSIECIRLALMSAPREAGVRIMNQMTEVFEVGALARMVSGISGAEIRNLPNPRREHESNRLAVNNSALLELGLRPHRLTEDHVRDQIEFARLYSHNADMSSIISTVPWNRTISRMMPLA